jgi:hypothetical protein
MTTCVTLSGRPASGVSVKQWNHSVAALQSTQHKAANTCRDWPTLVYSTGLGSATSAHRFHFDDDGVCRVFYLAGTPNYASLRSLLRIPQTPRDDLEALVYCLLVSNGCQNSTPSLAEFVGSVW